MIINKKEFKKYNDFYYVSKDGEVYSMISHTFLKPLFNIDGYPYVDIFGRHTKIHRMVYEAWIKRLQPGEQVNHRDDNKVNISLENLNIGTQKENIHDCMINQHRVGHIVSCTVYDSYIGEEITFPSIKDLINYTGHSVKNNSLSKMKRMKWFTNRYEVIKTEGVETRKSYELLRKEFENKMSLIGHTKQVS